ARLVVEHTAATSSATTTSSAAAQTIDHVAPTVRRTAQIVVRPIRYRVTDLAIGQGPEAHVTVDHGGGGFFDQCVGFTVAAYRVDLSVNHGGDHIDQFAHFLVVEVVFAHELHVRIAQFVFTGTQVHVIDGAIVDVINKFAHGGCLFRKMIKGMCSAV